MKRQKKTLNSMWRLYMMLMMWGLAAGMAQAKEFYGYTSDRPLVIACDWDFQPYEFLNTNGQPAGYNVDVLNLILNKLDIPHKFVMQEWYLATEMFERREADLIHALTFAYKGHPYVMTKKYINYYALRTARRLDMPPLVSVRDLHKGDTLLLKKNDYAALCIQQENDTAFTIEYRSPKDALTNIRKGLRKYYIWGEVPLSKKIKELALDSIILDNIDIPAGELRIIGYDKELVDIIDDEFTRLEQAGDLEIIYDKWFHPEREHKNTSPIALFLILGIVVIGIIAFLFSRLITMRVNNAMRKSVELNNMMKMALGMGDFFITEYNMDTGIISNRYGKLLPEGGMQKDALLDRIHPDERDEFVKSLTKLVKGESDYISITKRWNVGTLENPEWRCYSGDAILEKEGSKPKYIIHAIKDITKEVKEEQSIADLVGKYEKMFDTNVIAMSFYDKEGQLLYLNEEMKNICEFDDERERYFRSINLFDIPTIKNDFSKSITEDLHFCQHMHLADLGIDKYIESRIKPIIDENGELYYFIITTRNVTKEREVYMEQHKHEIEMQKTNDAIQQYEEQLRYLLENSNMFVWDIDLKTRDITFSRSLSKMEFSMNRKDYVEFMAEDEREEADKNFMEMVMKGSPFNAVHHFSHTPIHPHPVWLALSGIPTHNANGQMTGYFGIARDITDLMQAQQKLKEETMRAEDSGQMKAAFLANMTHEIRTPLNAIVGFSDILQMVDTEEERKEFIRIIRNNCDMLLRLINDILEASSLKQALAVEPTDINLSQVFDDICQTLEQRVQEPGVTFIKDNPYDTFPATLDKGRLQQVLTNFVTNAVKYTHEGHIKVGYREQDGGIYFYCEDTGAGIPKEKQAAVFDRFVKLNDFVQGTGLGLSICKSICERCGGHIGVTSEGEGHGSTFWMWMPRNITKPQ